MAKDSEHYSAAETERRMNDGLRRALNTPHKQNADFVGKGGKTKSAAPKRRKLKHRGQ